MANKAPPPVSYDLFDVKQYQGETLKEYINRFGAQVVKVGVPRTALKVGSDDMATSYRVGVWIRRQSSRREGSRVVRVIASY